jgi:ribonuclease BN (tRNA processing enzyme)
VYAHLVVERDGLDGHRRRRWPARDVGEPLAGEVEGAAGVDIARDGPGRIAYLTDNELGEGAGYPVRLGKQLLRFLSGTDTLIHDAMYAEQIIQARCGWGHSTPRQAVALAAEAGCRRLILFHHEPEHDDDALDRLLEDTRGFASRTAGSLQVDAAAEGMELPL